MLKRSKPIEPRQFILNSPSPRPSLTQADVRGFILQHDFPPRWGADMEAELKSRLMALGFTKIWCECMETHRVAHIRMTCMADEPPLPAAIRRLLRRVGKELGCAVPANGNNVWVRRNRVHAAFVMA